MVNWHLRLRALRSVVVAIVCAMTFPGVAVLGVWLGSASHHGGKAVAAPRVVPSSPPAPVLEPAAAQQSVGAQEISLALLNPITGPDQPPLPEDELGPSGSRHTTGTAEVALTFDDGPDPRFTPEVLALLKQYNVKATFCLIGVNVVQFPELVRQIVAEGHTICNHSWIHDLGLGNRGKPAILADLSRTNDAIHAAEPRARISYFRQPGGMWTPAVVASARQLGMTSLHWQVDPKDWLKPGSRAIASTITSSTLPGSIVLMHDGGGDRRGTVDALRTILPNLTARFSLVALPPGVDRPRYYGSDVPIHNGQL